MPRTQRPRWISAITLLGVLAVLVVAVHPGSEASAQNRSLRVNLHVLRTANGAAEFCINLRDRAAGDTRQCPGSRRLTVARAPEQRWVRSQSIFIAPEVSVWVRARRVGTRIDFGLGLSIEGVARGLRANDWTSEWNALPLDAWLLTSFLPLRLPVAPHPELWPPEAGLAAGARRLEVGKAAPEFSLPALGDASSKLVSLAAARSEGETLTLIVFWSSWAPFVGETLTVLGDLDARHNDIAVIGVNVYEVTADAGVDFAQTYGVDLLHLVDPSGSVAQHYRVDGLPELFVLDGDGVYRGVIRGAAPMAEILFAIYGVE